MTLIAKALAVALVVGLLGIAGGLTAPAEAARNQTPGCATKKEFRRVKHNQPIGQVRRIIGAKGRIASDSSFDDGDRFVTLSFRQCGRSWATSLVRISFESTEHMVYVPDVECFDLDGDGYAEDCEDFGSNQTSYSDPLRLTSKSAYWF